jgi:hypothetical protein
MLFDRIELRVGTQSRERVLLTKPEEQRTYLTGDFGIDYRKDCCPPA